MKNEIKFLLISTNIIILLPLFNIKLHSVVSDIPQNLEYEIKFKIPHIWKYLPNYNVNEMEDIGTTYFVLTQNDSVISYKSKKLYGYRKWCIL